MKLIGRDVLRRRLDGTKGVQGMRESNDFYLLGSWGSHPDDIKMALKRYTERMLAFVANSQGGDNAMKLLNPQTL